MSERLEVTFMTLSNDPKTPVLATLGIHIISSDMYLSGLKLIQKKDGTFYVASPSQKYMDAKTGKEAYGDYFWFGKKSSEFFQNEALKAITAYSNLKSQPNPLNGREGSKECVQTQNASPTQMQNQIPVENQSTFKNLNSMTGQYT